VGFDIFHAIFRGEASMNFEIYWNPESIRVMATSEVTYLFTHDLS
jgi:hypothetical protein